MNPSSFPPRPRTASRRDFLRTSTVFLAAASCPRLWGATTPAEPIIDIHGHILYSGRQNDVFFRHQRIMGATQTVLLPSGDRGRDHKGGSGEHEGVVAVCQQFPQEYVGYFANEISDLPDATRIIERQLRRGAIGIGEQKFRVDCDSPHLVRIAEVAREFNVPIIMHFQHDTYNRHIERFPRMLERFPTVNFIGHAQAWWANIDKDHDPVTNRSVSAKDGDKTKGKGSSLRPVTPGGLTDRMLKDYPNCYADISAGSGSNAILRDEEHYRGFILRHQDKLMFGSDCSEATGVAPACIGARTIAAIRRLAPSKEVERKILHGNARKLLKLA